jgi:hypothetical protein
MQYMALKTKRYLKPKIRKKWLTAEDCGIFGTSGGGGQ